jgi:outer membrane protein assembly factor BamB
MLYFKKFKIFATIVVLIISIISCIQDRTKIQNNTNFAINSQNPNQQKKVADKKYSPPKSYSTYRSSYNRRGVVSINSYQPNSAYQQNLNLSNNVPEQIWEENINGPFEGTLYSFTDKNLYRQVPLPIVYQNLLIRSSFDGKITFYDITSSEYTYDYSCYKKLYTLDTKLSIRGTPSFDFPYLYFGSAKSDKPNFTCFNWSTKKVNWSVQLKEEVYSSPIIDKDAIYVSSNLAMYCLDRKTGKIKWQFLVKDKSSIFSNPSFDEKYVYFMDTREGTETTDDVITIHAMEPSSGKEVWSYELKTIYNYFISSLMVENNFLVVSTKENTLVIDTNNGSLYWEIPVKKETLKYAENENTVLWNGKVYTASQSIITTWNITKKQKESEFKIAETMFSINDLILNEKENALYCSGVRSRSEYGSWHNDGVGYIAKISLDEKKIIWEFDFRSPHHIEYSLTTLLYNSQILACEMYSEGDDWVETLYVYK